MTINTSITIVLNGTIESVKSVIPISMGIDKPSVIQQPFTRNDKGVLIGITGSLQGRLIIEGNEDVFSKIGEAMFGMPLEGDMLDSFTGELGNMIAGNLATSIANTGVDMDITPPSLLIGNTQITEFDKGLSLPIHLSSVGSFTIILMVMKAT